MRSALLLTLLLATGCAQTVPPVAAAELTPMPRWHAVLVAGDPSLEVWDRAVEQLRDRLRAGGRVATIRSFSARRERLAAGAEPALRDNVLGAIAAMRPAAGEACLVFLTMHGAPQRGLALAAEGSFINPANLDAALGRGCGWWRRGRRHAAGHAAAPPPGPTPPGSGRRRRGPRASAASASVRPLPRGPPAGRSLPREES